MENIAMQFRRLTKQVNLSQVTLLIERERTTVHGKRCTHLEQRPFPRSRDILSNPGIRCVQMCANHSP